MKRILWVLLLVALIGCGGTAASTAQQQTVDGVVITLTPQAAPTINQQQTWLIELQRDGKPIDGADVYLDLEMPSMSMGQNKPLAIAQGNGVYKAEGTYTMGGAWHVTVHATVDTKDVVATFEINVPE